MRKIVYLLFAVLVLSCQDDFDEWNDTDQRTISFDISTASFFEDYLFLSGGIYSKGYNAPLESTHRIRLTCYCYDKNDSLILSTKSLLNGTKNERLQLRHLMKDQEYRFEFLCDVVKYDKAVDYYESWFQLGTNDINSFYLFCFQPDSIHAHNIVKHATLYATPDNNNVSVSLKPITINGYCVLSNLQGVEMVNGYYAYNESFYLDKMFGRKRSTHTYSYMPKGANQIVIPVTTGAIADTLSIKVKRIILNDVDSTFIYIHNPENKCFVSEIDCKTLKQKSCVYY